MRLHGLICALWLAATQFGVACTNKERLYLMEACVILVASLTHNTGNRTTAFRVAHQLVRALSARHGDREACDHGADVDTVKQHDEVFAETQAIVFSSSVAKCLVLDVHKVNTSGMLSSASHAVYADDVLLSARGHKLAQCGRVH